MYDDLFPDARSDSLGQILRRPAAPETPPGPWQGFGSAVADALPYAANTSASAWSAVMEAYGHAAAYRDTPTNALVNAEAPPAPAALQAQTLDRMGNSETARGFREQARRYAPDPASVGIAGQVVHGLISGMAKMTAYAGAGPAGPALFGLDTGINRAQELTDQGVDDRTAAAAGLVSGVAGAATMIVPPALGATRLQSAAIGGVVAPAMTVAEVGGIRAILERADYENIAAQYQPFDPVNLAVSALAGAAFGGLFHRGRAGERAVSPDEHAAALVMNEARTRDADTLTRPGDIEAATAAHDAQARAREQLDRGELVSVAQMIGPDIPTLESARVMAFDRMTADLRAELTAEAGGRAEAGAVARMTEERAALESRIEALQADTAMRDEAKAHQAAGLSRKQAEAAARNTLPEKLAELEARAERLDRQLEMNRRAAQAEQDLARLDQGTLPERFLAALEGRADSIVRGFQERPIALGVRDAMDGGSIPPAAPRAPSRTPDFESGARDAPTSFVDHVRQAVGALMGKQETEQSAPVREGRSAGTPEQARAAEIAARSPDAVVRLEDGSEVRMADLLQHADAIEKSAKTERAAFEAAVNCAVRYS